MHTFNQSIRDIFRNSLNHSSRKPFLIIRNNQLNYGVLKSKIGKLTSYLQNAGISAGDRIVLSSKNEEFLCSFYLAMLANGVTVIFIDSDSSQERANSIINFCQPKRIFIDEYLINKWQLELIEFTSVVPMLFDNKSRVIEILIKKVKASSILFPACIEELPEIEPLGEINPEWDAYVLFTSGTTSAPKGVRISYRALFSHLQTLSNVYEINPHSKIFNNLILSHADGMVQGPLLAFYSKSTVYRPFPFSIQRIEDIFDIIYQEKITHWVIVPTMISLINQFKRKDTDTLDNKEFRYIISCGGKLEQKLWQDFEVKYRTKIINGYGLTETVAGGLSAGPDEKTHKVGTVGAPVDCDAKIVDNDGVELHDGESGEIWLRGTMLMSGYLNAPELNDEVFFDGWLKTGDIGYKGDDGCFRIIGRKKSVIISGGYNINPDEITEVINAHNAISDAVTFGIDNDIWGEIAVSAVVLKSGFTIKEEDLIKHCRKHLEERKVPSNIYFFKELPYGRSGKVILHEIKDKILDIDPKENLNVELNSNFLAIVSKCLQLPVEDISMDISAEDTDAWDSMSHLIIIAEFEKQFNIEFSPVEVMNITLLSELYAILERKLKK